MVYESLEQNKCFITGEPIEGLTWNYPLLKQGYVIPMSTGRVMIQYDLDSLVREGNSHGFQKFILENRHIFKGLLYNRKWLSANEQSGTLINRGVLEHLIANSDFPKTPAEKKENLFITLSNQSRWAGDQIVVYQQRDQLIKLCYFLSDAELKFYLETLADEGLILGHVNQGGSWFQTCVLTYKGLSEIIKLSEEGQHSNRCFVAMSFDPEDVEIFAAIKDACYEAGGYDAFRVSDEHLDSVQTINDGIIAGIKKSKFCIADFTKQKDGVYFESGFAAGRGIKVIYTCREDWFKQTHFDTKHFPHIRYTTTDQLKAQLIKKIQAWIVD